MESYVSKYERYEYELRFTGGVGIYVIDSRTIQLL